MSKKHALAEVIRWTCALCFVACMFVLLIRGVILVAPYVATGLQVAAATVGVDAALAAGAVLAVALFLLAGAISPVGGK